MTRRLVIENRSDAPVNLAYLVHGTGERGVLAIGARQTSVIEGEPSRIAWLNASEVPHAILPASAVDAIDADRGPDDAPWRGLACSVEGGSVTVDSVPLDRGPEP